MVIGLSARGAFQARFRPFTYFIKISFGHLFVKKTRVVMMLYDTARVAVPLVKR